MGQSHFKMILTQLSVFFERTAGKSFSIRKRAGQRPTLKVRFLLYASEGENGREDSLFTPTVEIIPPGLIRE